MRIALFIALALLSCHLFAQEKSLLKPVKCCENKTKVDSSYINYYIINYTDTVYFTANAGVMDCFNLASIIPAHNKCRFFSFQKAMTGIYYIHTPFLSLNGIFKDGNIENASEIKYSRNGKVSVTGQYTDNWKTGLWTVYYENGTIESINKYIPGYDDAVEIWEYDEKGKLVQYVNEEKDIRKLLEKGNKKATR